MKSSVLKDFTRESFTPPNKSCDNSQNSNRIEWIDTAKGIAAILVVFGHIASSGGFVSSFHMPLFFTLSGMFAVKNLKMGFKTHFQYRFKRLMIPYLIFGLFLLVPFYWIYFHFIIPTAQIPLPQRWLAHLTGLHSDWGEEWRCCLWFLPCLFSADLIVWSIWKYAYKYRYYALVAVVLSGVLYYLTINRSLPFRIHTALIAVGFMSLGVFLKNKISNFSLPTILVCTFGYGSCWYGNHFSPIVMADNNYGLIYFSIPAAIFATIVVLYISRFAVNISLLSLIGRQSLMVYILHQVLVPFVIALSKRLGILEVEIKEDTIMPIIAIGIAWLCMKLGVIIQAKWPWMLGENKKQVKIA